MDCFLTRKSSFYSAGNSLVIVIVVTSRRMQTVTNYFIANLALADVVIGLFSIPFQFQVSLSKYCFLLLSRAAQILGGLIFESLAQNVKVYQVSEPRSTSSTKPKKQPFYI